jgi:hypothetical protein
MSSDGSDGSNAALVRMFELGMLEGRDPSSTATIEGGRAITRLRSPWLRKRCPATGHSFRTGDPVVIGEDRCVSLAEGVTVEQETQLAQAFFEGLSAAWPPPEHVVRLPPGHELLAPPSRGFSRYSCAVCGHTLRAGDHVIICPCSPEAPLCRGTVHRDPARNLPCWDNYQSMTPGLCPVTTRRIKA